MRSIGDEVGVQPDSTTGRFNTTVMNQARNAAGTAIGDFYRNNPVALTPSLDASLTAVENNMKTGGADENTTNQVMKTIDHIRTQAAQNGGVIPSNWLGGAMSTNGVIRDGANSSGPAAPHFRNILTAVDNAFDNQAPASEVANYDRARYQYNRQSPAQGWLVAGGGLPVLSSTSKKSNNLGQFSLSQPGSR